MQEEQGEVMPRDIDTGDVVRDEGLDLDFATEVACDSFVSSLISSGRLTSIGAASHLMYLPDQKVIQQFKEACKAVYECLKKAQEGAM